MSPSWEIWTVRPHQASFLPPASHLCPYLSPARAQEAQRLPLTWSPFHLRLNVCFKESPSWRVPLVQTLICGWRMETGGGGNSPRSQGSLVMLVGKAPRPASSWVRAPVQLLGTSGHHPHKKMEIFLRDVFDSPQRSPALTFSLCLRQGKCFHCKSEIRSRVVPDCLTQYLHNVYVLCDFSWWPSVAVAALSEVAASGEYPGKGIHLSGRLERTSIPHVVWLFGSPCCS